MYFKISDIRSSIIGLLLVSSGTSLTALPAAEIEWIGRATLPGTMLDKSGIEEPAELGIPRNYLGGWSALEHLEGNRYIALSDRGPQDGAVSFPCRFHELTIQILPGGTQPVQVTLEQTILLKDIEGRPFTGRASVLQGSETVGHRLDPEGLRILRGHPATLLVSEEYGPEIFEFRLTGEQLRALPVPARFRPGELGVNSGRDLAETQKGRQDNGGFEGLACTVTGEMNHVWAILQRPLLQDRAFERGQKAGVNCRVLKISESRINTGAAPRTQEFVYQLDAPALGVSEILAIDQQRFLVLERDGEVGSAAQTKRIYLADATAATDVSHLDGLPRLQLPNGVTPLQKSLFIDLLDTRWPIAQQDIAEKYEGLCWGPDLADGRAVLLISVDNDFESSQKSEILAFAVRW